MNNEAFDWNLAVARANGNKDLAHELSGLLVENIKECVPDLKNAWLNKDLESLRHLSHKMHGGAAYTGAIGIQNASKNFEKAVVDDAFQTDDIEALNIIFNLINNQKIILGGSSGINIAGAIKLAKKMGPGKTIVTILCDNGLRYASKIFNKDFLKSKKLPIPTWL